MDIVVIAKNETLVQKGINRSLTKEDLIQSISKFGDTSFNISNIQIDMDEGLMIPASQINIARREAARQLEEKICDSYTRKLNNSNLELSKNESKEITKNKISAYLYTIDNLEGMEEIDKVYLPFDKVVQDKTISSRIANSYLKNKEIVIDLGNISKGQTDKEILNNIDMLKKFGNVLVGNLEQLEMLKGSGLNIELDSSLNVYNSSSIEGFKKIGIKDISLSNELTKEQISRIDNRGTDLSINIYGRLSAMTLQSCMISNNISKKAHCSLCDKKSYYLKDRVGEKYPILSNTLDCRNTILSSDTLFNLEAIQKLKNTVTVFRIYFYDETSTQRRNVISKVVKVIDGADASSINTDGYSKGHFSRGV